MQTGKIKISKNLKSWILTGLILIIIVLSSINISIYTNSNKVLGLKTTSTSTLSENDFWRGFLEKYPNYLPGHLEVGDFEKAAEIDPNYIIP